MRDAWWYLGAVVTVAFLAVACWVVGGWILRWVNAALSFVHLEGPKE